MQPGATPTCCYPTFSFLNPIPSLLVSFPAQTHTQQCSRHKPLHPGYLTILHIFRGTPKPSFSHICAIDDSVCHADLHFSGYTHCTSAPRPLSALVPSSALPPIVIKIVEKVCLGHCVDPEDLLSDNMAVLQRIQELGANMPPKT